MVKVSWKLFKLTYPFICGACGYLHYDNRETCESCGKKFEIREVKKIDYKIWKAK